MRFRGLVKVSRLAMSCLTAAGLALISAIAPAHAEKRVAVVIGNDSYANLERRDQLQKAVSDARAVGAALRRIGFDIVEGENAGRQAMIDRLDEAVRRVSPGDTFVFFFSGHGIAVDGTNYILPADVPVVGSGQITRLTGAAIREDDITAALARAGARVTVLVLDACRNNPFATAGTKGIGGEKGLAPHEPPGGVFTLYAAGRGEAALDRLSDSDPDPNSVFTRVLLPRLARPDLDLPALAVEVRDEVTRLAKSVNHSQRPAYYDETTGGRVYLAGSLAAAPSAGGALPLLAAPAAAPAQTIVAQATPAADPCAAATSLAARCAVPLPAELERALKPKETFKECSDCPEMVAVPAGSFTMGSPKTEAGRDDDEGPQHVVTIGRPFAVGRVPVTVEQFAAFIMDARYDAGSKCFTHDRVGDGKEQADRSWRNPGFEQERSHPAVCLNWSDARAYVEWLARKTEKPYRLLSEAEWEYAARGRTSPGAYPRAWFGDDDKALCQHGNVADQKARDSIPQGRPLAPCDDGFAHTSPAGHYGPNAFGLYDMSGNVMQWTADCYHPSYDGAPADGTAWTAGGGCNRVVRGSAWSQYGSAKPVSEGAASVRYPVSWRAAFRNQQHSDARSDETGIRVGRTLNQ
jgi:formylglycine-generating enzyme required for sulfatase activity